MSIPLRYFLMLILFMMSVSLGLFASCVNQIVAPRFMFDMYTRSGTSLRTMASEDICRSMTVQLNNSIRGERGIINVFMPKMQCMTSTMIEDVAKHTSSHTRQKTSTMAPTHRPIILPPTLRMVQKLRISGQKYIVSPVRRSLRIVGPCGFLDKRTCIHHKVIVTLNLQ